MSTHNAAVEQQILALENQWMEAWRTHDIETFARILSDDFTLTSALSRGELMDKTTWLKHAGQDYQATSFAFDKILVRVFSDVAVVNSWYHQITTARGQGWSEDFLLTDVWVRRGESWQVVTRHSSRPIAKK